MEEVVKHTNLYNIDNFERGQIPFTELTIDKEGKVTNSYGEICCKPYKDHGTWCVKLPIKEDGVVYLNELKLGTLTSIVFKNVKLPWRWWKDIDLFYRDDDPYNVDPANIAHQMYPEHFKYTHEGVDYKVIPNFTRYGISKEGVVYNPTAYAGIRKEEGKLSFGYTAVKKYKEFLITPDIDRGGNTGLGRHRLLAMCYPIGPDLDQVYGKDHQYLQINHIDHTPGNDTLINLEWVTNRENQIHSVINGGLNSERRIPIIVYDFIKSKLYRLDSYMSAERILNLPSSKISRAVLADDYQLIYGRYRAVRDRSDDEEHEIILRRPNRKQYMLYGTLFVYDKEELILEGSVNDIVDKLINEFNAPLRIRNIILNAGEWRSLKFEIKLFNFEVYSASTGNGCDGSVRGHRKKIIMYDYKEAKYFIFNDLDEVSVLLDGLAKTTIAGLARGDVKRLYKSRYSFGYFDPSVKYDNNHPMANMEVGTKNYFINGEYVVKNYNGHTVFVGVSFEDINEHFNLGSNTSNLREKFKRTGKRIVPDHSVEIRLAGHPTWYGASIFN